MCIRLYFTDVNKELENYNKWLPKNKRFSIFVVCNCSFLNMKNFNIISEKCFSHITSRGIPVFPGRFQGDSQGPKGFCRVLGVGRGLKGSGRTRQSQGILELVPTVAPCRFFLNFSSKGSIYSVKMLWQRPWLHRYA